MFGRDCDVARLRARRQGVRARAVRGADIAITDLIVVL